MTQWHQCLSTSSFSSIFRNLYIYTSLRFIHFKTYFFIRYLFFAFIRWEKIIFYCEERSDHKLFLLLKPLLAYIMIHNSSKICIIFFLDIETSFSLEIWDKSIENVPRRMSDYKFILLLEETLSVVFNCFSSSKSFS